LKREGPEGQRKGKRRKERDLEKGRGFTRFERIAMPLGRSVDECTRHAY
jgi:hypothetical protein